MARVIRRYLAVYGLAFVAFAGTLAGLNIQQDPYDVFASFKGKPAPIWGGTSTRMAKAYALRQQQPDCLILGTSRAAIGYGSAHPGFAGCTRIYNVGLQKAHIYELRRYLEHAMAEGEVKRVFLPLDFEMFRNTDVTIEGYSEDRLAVSPEGHRQAFPLNEILGLALSLDSLKLSLMTLRSPHPATPWFEPSGDWNDQTLSNVLEIPKHGAWGTSQSATRILANLLGKQGAYTTDANGRLPYMSELERIVTMCREHGIALTMVIDPVHSSYHELLFQIGLHDDFDAWKAQAGKIILANSPGQKVWDFDRRNRYSEEPIPPQGELARLMEGFWDPSHLRHSLGDHVLNVALSGRDPMTEELFTGAAATAPWSQDNAERTELIRYWLDGVKK